MKLTRFDALQARDLLQRFRHPGTDADLARTRASALRLLCRLGVRAEVGAEEQQLWQVLNDAAETRKHHEIETA